MIIQLFCGEIRIQHRAAVHPDLFFFSVSTPCLFLLTEGEEERDFLANNNERQAESETNRETKALLIRGRVEAPGCGGGWWFERVCHLVNVQLLMMLILRQQHPDREETSVIFFR